MGKLNLKLGCLVYPCFSCSTFLFTEKSLHKDLPVVLGVQYIVKIEKNYLLHSHFFFFFLYTNPKRVELFIVVDVGNVQCHKKPVTNYF